MGVERTSELFLVDPRFGHRLCFECAGVLLEFAVAWVGREHAVDVPIERRAQGFGVVIVCGVDADVVVVDSLEQRTVDGRGRPVVLALAVLLG